MPALIKKYRSRLIPVVLLILLFALMLSRVFRPGGDSSAEMSISYQEAADYSGIIAEVCGDVVSATFAGNIGGQPTFINFGANYPDQVFTVVIWRDNINRWQTPPADLYSDRFICARGRIQIHNDVPQIVVSQPDQISFNRRY